MAWLRQIFARAGEVIGIDVEANEFFDAAGFGGESGMADANKGIKHRHSLGASVKFDAEFGEGHGKGCGVGTLVGAIVNRFIGDEPGVAAAAEVMAIRVSPAGDIALVRVGHADGQPTEAGVSRFGEVEHELVAIVDVAV